MALFFDTEHIIQSLTTEGFCLIEHFLELDHYQTLVNLAQKKHQEGVFKEAKIGQNIQTQHNHGLRSDEICWIDADSDEPAIKAYLKRSKDLARLLNHHLFLGLSEFETHFATYPIGSFYKKHVDQFAHDKTRKISCVYYLNQEWKEAFDGALKLYTREGQLIERVLPYGNRFICFDSELPHEVSITHHPRYSITGWMKTRSKTGLPSSQIIDLSQI